MCDGASQWEEEGGDPWPLAMQGNHASSSWASSKLFIPRVWRLNQWSMLVKLLR